LLSIHAFGTLIITFGLTAIPYSVYYYTFAARQRNQTFSRLKQYLEIAVFFSLLYLLLFSLYKFRPPASVLKLLQPFNMKFIAASCFISSVIVFMHAQFKKRNIAFTCELNRIPKYIIITLWVFLLLVYASLAFTKTYGIVPIEQLIFHLALPRTGANFSMVKRLFVNPFINALLVLIFFLYILSGKIYINKRAVSIPFSKYRKTCTLVAAILPAAGIMYAVFATGLPQYLLGTPETPSTFYEEHYISPDDAAITFPERKRNLIVIVIESLETGFLTVENGGVFAEDVMPEITELAKNHVNFSGNDGIGGAVQLFGTGWTVAGITSYYSGVPLALSLPGGNYGVIADEFLPGISSIGDILHNAGYNSYFFLGSDIAFGGRDKYFKTHKDTVIFDYNYFRDNNYISKNYNVWWGMEDRKLYRFAKDMIPDIVKEEPFFITLLTADTHPSGGYLDKEAEEVFDSRYKNVLRDTSKQLSAFVEWLQEQNFYENTTVVILGDHLYMDSSVFPGDSAHDRYPLNIFINSPLNPNAAKGRSFSHFDMFPLLVESIGGTYTGEGLSLGRSPHAAGGETLVEKYGSTVLNEQLRRKSELYNALWGAGG
jgi:phosphoglycerol transferase